MNSNLCQQFDDWIAAVMTADQGLVIVIVVLRHLLSLERDEVAWRGQEYCVSGAALWFTARLL